MAGVETYRPDVSVVINTLNRGWILDRAIQSLRYQDYDRFEVIVVNGPSTDNTDAILEPLGRELKIERIDEANLSKSRNAGIAAAAGDIVLFLDDDAFAEPGWISNIVAAYADPRVGGVGTRVWDHFGFAEQSNPRLIDEHYNPIFEARLPAWAFQYPDSRTVPHILGASSSFRRDILTKIGGFDEEIEYYLDESEVCRRIAELGYLIIFLETGASVHHKFAPGVVRDDRKLLTHPYPVVKNKFYVCLADAARSRRSMQAALAACTSFAEHLLVEADTNLAARRITPKEHERFGRDVVRGVSDGRERGLCGVRQSRSFDPAPALWPFPALRPAGGSRTFCFICRHLPQRSPGGVAKFLYDLAKGFAALGHDVTIVTEAVDQSEILYQDGIWIRSLAVGSADLSAADVPAVVESQSARDNFQWSFLAHREVTRIAEDRIVDLVVTPIWNTEGLHCVLDDSLRTVVTLQTTFATFADVEWRSLDRLTVEELLIFERLLVERAAYVHSISHAIEEQVRSLYQPRRPDGWMVAHLGVDDVAAPRDLARRDGEADVVRIGYVSRLERRKGTDIFLAVAARLVKENPRVRIDLVGRDVGAQGARSAYAAMVAHLPAEARERIVFRGQIDDDALLGAYGACDIFCVPSRFESFGLIYLEAMRAAKPVVACAVGGVPEIVVDGTTGLLVPPDDANALHAALERLIVDKSLRRQFGAAGRQRFEKLFTSEKMVERTLGVYETMIDA